MGNDAEIALCRARYYLDVMEFKQNSRKDLRKQRFFYNRAFAESDAYQLRVSSK